MSNFVLNAQARAQDKQGKGASRRLRREALVPAIIYGGNAEPLTISIELRQIVKVLEDNTFFSSIITIEGENLKEEVVIKALQRHPAKNTPIHADFMRITRGEELTTKVPVSFLNQEKSKGVKAGGIATFTVTEIEVTTLPRNLPDNIEVDLADLEIGQSIHLSQVKLPQGVKLAHVINDNNDLTIVSIVAPTIKPEEETPAASEE